MTRAQGWFVLIAMTLIAALGLSAQQQFSGGNPATQSGIWSMRLQDGSGSGITSTGAALDINLKTGSIANSAFGVNAGTAKIGIVYPYTSCGTTAFTVALQAMPTSSTAIAAATTCVVHLEISNTTAGALTVTVSDNAGTPINYLNAVSLTAGETRSYNFPNGMKFTSGIKVQASGAGITYGVEGLQ